MASLEQHGPVLTATLSEPTLTATALAALHDALDAAETSARLLVLRGAPATFCAGMDMGEAAGETDPRAAAARFFDLLRRFTTSPVVVVSAVDGVAAGGGLGLVAASDVAFATSRSRFSLPELLWGLLPCCVLPFVIRRAGFQTAYAMAVGGRTLTAAEAERTRLVDDACADAGAGVRRLAQRVTRTAPATIADAKAYFGRLHPIGADAEQRAVDELTRLMSSTRFRAAAHAFAADGVAPWTEAR